MKLPVDTSAIAFLCALEPQPVLDFETRQPRADENGEALYMVQLIAMSDGAADIIAIKVPGLPGPGIRQGHPVKVHGPGRPALDDGRPLGRGVPGGSHRVGRPRRQGELTREEVEPKRP
jgi:hypothetical protein